MSESVGSVRWNGCVHRLDLGFFAHPKEFWGDGVKTHVTSKGKILSTGSSEEGRTHAAASCRTASPTHYRLSCSGPSGRVPPVVYSCGHLAKRCRVVARTGRPGVSLP